MKRSLLTGFVFVLLAGCQSLQDQEAMRPLPETGPKPAYTELLLRARRQSDLALDRAFRNLWGELEDVARMLGQTAKLLPSAPEAPAKKAELEQHWKDLAEDAKKLENAARDIPGLTGADQKKKQDEIDQYLLRISRAVRTLRAMN